MVLGGCRSFLLLVTTIHTFLIVCYTSLNRVYMWQSILLRQIQTIVWHRYMGWGRRAYINYCDTGLVESKALSFLFKENVLCKCTYVHLFCSSSPCLRLLIVTFS